MHPHKYWGFALLILALVGCSEERRTELAAPDPAGGSVVDPEALANAFVGQAGWPVEVGHEGTAERNGALPLFHFERTPIAADVVHYSVELQVGSGPYDRIGVHRVVRERRPFQPIRTDQTLFLLHGDLKDFDGMFLPGQSSPNRPDDFGLASYLAQNDVDVWGMDQGWNFVPQEETDFSFFSDWGIQKEVDHLEIALAVARFARLATGNGFGPMPLLGYSSGSVTGYALLNQESQRPRGRRQVSAYIAADFGVRSDDPIWLGLWEEYVPYYEALYDGGQFQDPLIYRDAGILARTLPDGESPYFPGMTNEQVALFFGGGPLWPPSDAHFHAPILEDGFPTALQFVTIPEWLDFLEDTAAYEPILFELEYTKIAAGWDSPFVDHLGDITVPVLDVGGAGGIAPYTSATTSYLGSDDITQLYVSVGAPEPATDYGHIDIFTAHNAPQLVWQPILEWVAAHTD
ncbi:MAG: hypothetical protein R3E97_01790 [Candidatus Eisenbacteria bacterium]